MSIFKKIFLLVAITITLILITITSIMISYQRKSIEVEYNNSMSANNSIVIGQLEQTVEYFTSFGLSFSNNRQLQIYFESMDLEDENIVNKARDVLKKMKDSSVILNNVTLTPRDGIIRLDALGAFYDAGPDESEFDYFKELSTNPSLKYIVNKPLVGSANNEPIFGIGIQMDNDGEFLGILGLPINLNRLMDYVIMPDIADEDVKVMMVNNSGTIVWASYKELIHNQEVNLKESEPELFNQLTQTKKGHINQSILGLDAQINYDYYEAFDAYIIIYKDIYPYKILLIGTVIRSVFLGIVILILSSVLMYFFLLKITKPIVKLVGYSNSIANEEYDIRISQEIVERNDEIGKLGRTYQTMANNLNKSFIKIQSFGEKHHYLANHDELTNLPNRRCFNKLVSDFQDAFIFGYLIMIDIDNFKNINDTKGHFIGDEVLKAVAKRLSSLVSEDVLISRFGGDEFIIYIKENERKVHIEEFINSLVNLFINPIRVNSNLIHVKFSIGVSLFPENSNKLEELIRQADIALYLAKNEGKNRVEFFENSMEQLVFEKVNIENELSESIANDGFHLVYQPQVELETGEVKCYEALLRLKSDKYNPSEFIPVAEENLQIIPIGRWVVKEAIQEIVKWKTEGKGEIRVSVNFSGIQLQDDGFYDYVRNLLRDNSVPGRYLELEVTENVFIQQEQKVMKFFDNIVTLGVELSIDDFGTGYSSLTYMISFPVKKIKLDRQLILKYLRINDQDALEKLIQLIHSLDYTIVAEGVEEEEDVITLVKSGCDSIQGFYFSKPVKASEITCSAEIYKIP